MTDRIPLPMRKEREKSKHIKPTMMSIKTFIGAFSYLPITCYADSIATVLKRERNGVLLHGGIGCGKSLLLPYLLSERIPDRTVYMVYPTRHAASSALHAYQDTGGPMRHVARAKSQDRAERDRVLVRYVSTTELAVAIRRKEIDFSASIIVLDDAQTLPAGTTFTYGLLRSLIDLGEDIRLVVMSSDLDVDAHSAYWSSAGLGLVRYHLGGEDQPRPQIKYTDDPTEKITVESMANQVIKAIEEGHKTLALFCKSSHSAKQLNRYLRQIRQTLPKKHRYHTELVLGDGSDLSRKEFSSGFETSAIKIVIGFGVNFWLNKALYAASFDCGISDGRIVVPTSRNEITYSTEALESTHTLILQRNMIRSKRAAKFIVLGSEVGRSRFQDYEISNLSVSQEVFNVAVCGIPVDATFKTLYDDPTLKARIKRGVNELTLQGLMKNGVFSPLEPHLDALMNVTPRFIAAYRVAESMGINELALPILAMLEMGRRGIWHAKLPTPPRMTGDCTSCTSLAWVIVAATLISSWRISGDTAPKALSDHFIEADNLSVSVSGLVTYTRKLYHLCEALSIDMQSTLAPYRERLGNLQETGTAVDWARLSAATDGLKTHLMAALAVYYSESLMRVVDDGQYAKTLDGTRIRLPQDLSKDYVFAGGISILDDHFTPEGVPHIINGSYFTRADIDHARRVHPNPALFDKVLQVIEGTTV